MGEVYLNGRPAVDFELPAVRHARKCEHDRDMELLAGVLTEERVSADVPRPVTDLAWEFS